VLVIAHNADFDRPFLKKRLPAFATKHWACSRFDIDSRRRTSGHRRLNSSPTRWGFSTTATRPRAIVGLLSFFSMAASVAHNRNVGTRLLQENL
jgi:hypothetical protein